MFRLKQSNANNAVDGTNTTTLTVTLSGVAPGSLIIVSAIGENAGQTNGSVSDGTNTFERLPLLNEGGGNAHHGQLFFLPRSSPGDKTYTVTWEVSVGWKQMQVFEFTYTGRTPSLFAYSQGKDVTGASSAFDSGNLTTRRGDLLAFCGAGTHSSVTPVSYSINGGTPDGFLTANVWIHSWWKSLADEFTGKATANLGAGTIWWGTYFILESQPFGKPKIDLQAPEEEDAFLSEMTTKGWF